MEKKTMSFSFELLSHTDRTLQEHLDSCYHIGCTVLKQKIISPSLFSVNKVNQLFKQLVYFHDFGKATDFFQNKIIEATKINNQEFYQIHKEYITHFETHKQDYVRKAILQDDRLGNHSLLGAYFQLARIKQEDPLEDFILFKIIKKHHGDLTNFLNSRGKNQFLLQEEDLERLESQVNRLSFEFYQKIIPDDFTVTPDDWKEIVKRFSNILYVKRIADQLIKKKTVRYFFFQHYLFSLLLSADKGDVKVDNKDIIQPTYLFPSHLVEIYKKVSFGNLQIKQIDIERENAYHNIQDSVKKYASHNFFSITLPTGMGKTLSAYNAAVLLQNKSKGRPRIVYCLPFTSIIDQNVQVLSKI